MNRLIITILGIALLVACKTKVEQKETDALPLDRSVLMEEIAGLKSQIYSPDKKLLPDTAINLIKKQEAFAASFPTDSLSAGYLFEGASLAKTIGEPGLAIKLWGQFQRTYQKDPRAPQAIFYQAFTFENDIRDKNTAKNYYELLIKRYPKHALAEQAQFALDVLGKSGEELIEEFKNKK